MTNSNTVELAVKEKAQSLYKASYFIIGEQKLTYKTKFRHSCLVTLAEEYALNHEQIKKMFPTFKLIKEALIIRHFTNFGLRFAKYSDANIQKLVGRTIDLVDLPYEEEDTSIFDKIMSLFPKSELEKVDKYIEEALKQANEK